ncbi:MULTISPECIES: hypothetical protein [unclassified Variovorax]|uniref:hypothetical protein n=1 Tax=unclassified Variovorax TaxID=663243 RepID=UPI00076CC2E0|nr:MULTISPECIES: hypothetical protein [unclassified Variovorax]KWT67019.1 hypothetical protein APY03_7127 [Variovorax sp. WDL1]PNG49145.1 hypothetical protein CHC06_06382 [Variovorax sp. B2]PNG49530.1 hypothetical protein CHC07_06439 [Variovorax sp. B4]VTV18829.1 hypothetical protein WDL1P2_00458 [Variovorax sp. WDL1]
MDLNQQLTARYIEVLEATDRDFIATLNAYRIKPGNGLNDLFLPTVSANYSTAARKVMVMGRETRTWNYAAAANSRSLAEYVTCGMEKHARYRDSEHCLHSKTHGSGLIRLLKAVGRATGEAGLIYSNLFAVAHKGKDPRKNLEAWPQVRKLSGLLLDIQIETLRPDVIVFANGIDSAAVRREFFPHANPDDPKAPHRCTGSDNWKADGIGTGHLWGFTLDNRIQCYRLQHPSAKYYQSNATKAREHLIKLLAQNSQATTS